MSVRESGSTNRRQGLSAACTLSERETAPKAHTKNVLWKNLAGVLTGVVALAVVNDGLAQDAPVITTAPIAAAPAEAAPPPPPPPPPPPSAAVVIESRAERSETPPDVTPPPAAPSPPAEEGFKPKLTIGVGLRTGLSLVLNQPSDKVTLDLADSLDQLMFRPFFAGKLTKNIGLFAQFNAGARSVGIIDAYVDVKFWDEFQLVLGQHIPANDRNNFSGPFFNNSWNFAAVHSFPMVAAARDRGFTFWGVLAKGIVKYHLSMTDLIPQPGFEKGIQNSRFSGRVNFNFLDPENGYYLSGTYFGKQDTLALGGVFSYQNGAPDATLGNIKNDFIGFAVDALFEKNFGKIGTFTAQVGYWNFESVGSAYTYPSTPAMIPTGFSPQGFAGALSGINNGQSVEALVSWLSPTKVGIGQFQPNFRVQGFNQDAGDTKIYDVGLGYIIDGFNHMWRINYRHVDGPGEADSDALQGGVQVQI